MPGDAEMEAPEFGDDSPPRDEPESTNGDNTRGGQSGAQTRLSWAEQLEFNQLACDLGLDLDNRSMALRLAEKPENEWCRAITLYIASLGQGLRALQTRSASSSTDVDELRSWQASGELNEHIRRFAQTILTHPDLESYTATEDDLKRPLAASFEARVINHLNEQPAAWKARLLPPRLNQPNDPAPVRVMYAYVKKMIKHNRDAFRKMLLVHVLDEYKQPPTKPIPTLQDLITQIIIACGCAGINNRDQVVSSITVDQKMRFALLRMTGIWYHTHPTSNKNSSQWTHIDARLALLRRKTNIERQAFYALILEQDHGLFGTGTAKFSDLRSNPDGFNLPSDAEVEIRAAALRSRLA